MKTYVHSKEGWCLESAVYKVGSENTFAETHDIESAHLVADALNFALGHPDFKRSVQNPTMASIIFSSITSSMMKMFGNVETETSHHIVCTVTSRTVDEDGDEVMIDFWTYSLVNWLEAQVEVDYESVLELIKKCGVRDFTDDQVKLFAEDLTEAMNAALKGSSQ